MMNLTNLQLSAEESAMVMDSHWLLTKNSIMQKAYALFGEAAAWLQENIAQRTSKIPKDNFKEAVVDIPAELLVQSPKIARGENYNGLPYLMLDYPRYFGKEDVFAIRTMFWWGNFISVTWHLKGKYAKRYNRNLSESFDRLVTADFRVCTGEDEWRHDFDDDNYQSLRAIGRAGFSAMLSDKIFNKLAVKIPLDQWNSATVKLIEIYQSILDITSINYPACEKDLSPGNPIADSDL